MVSPRATVVAAPRRQVTCTCVTHHQLCANPPRALPPSRPTPYLAHLPGPQSAIFDFPALLTVIILFICTAAYLRAATYNTSTKKSFLDDYKHGVLGLAWKCARIGERLSPWVAAFCVGMAVHTLFFR
jgi:hypothetical protein